MIKERVMLSEGAAAVEASLPLRCHVRNSLSRPSCFDCGCAFAQHDGLDKQKANSSTT
jgi:hypothetical protein